MDSNWMIVYEALRRVYQEDAYSNIAINEAISKHPGCRDSFVRNMAKGTLRDTILLDYFIDKLAKSGISKIKRSTLTILRMGIFAIRSMNSIPEHSAVDEAVSLAKKLARGSEGFVNALLRNFLRQRDNLQLEIDNMLVRAKHADEECANRSYAHGLSLKYSTNEGIVNMLMAQYGEEAEAILEGLNTPPKIILRTNSMRIGRDELIDKLRSEGIQAIADDRSSLAILASGSRIAGSKLYQEGLYSIQNIASINSIEALAPSPGSRVLDMCAAPGGKSAMMAELMNNQGSIISCDIHEHRLKLIEDTANRLGINIISTKLLDGTSHVDEWDECFDIVLADVPCSGLGVIATKPEIKLRACETNELMQIQRQILQNAIRYVKPGGRLCYSTCTLNRNENERLVNSVIEGLECAQILEIKTFMPYNSSVGFFYSIITKNAQL